MKISISRRAILVALLSSMLCVGSIESSFAKHSKGNLVEANEMDPGGAIDVNKFLAKDKTTLFFVRSMVCPTCKRMTPRIVKLSGLNSDIRIVDVLLDRVTDSEIGFNSAAAKQFEVRATPTYVIYDKDGKVTKGDDADSQVDAWLKAAGV